ncbi:ABC transporter substrate-binding protein [Pararhodobacter sp. CCB-MM2]|uniref:ABC transporter substrate-binding protein n=1 Tax=Pararhodobacter sp. CCB-MM2 TaxID=1786003 RepID=UPI00082969DB|nr:ABC transporter substrate-binding protein [Pararhodobacter sp. CCB-MM2]MCA2011005.1 ABC transporter substrate-binding protein [Cereibacter sphaeroides]
MRKTLAAAALAALSTTALSPLHAEVPNDAQTLALAARIDNNSFDRAQLMIANQVQFWQPVIETLLTDDPNEGILPNLATEWSYNDDNTVLTLTLRDGISFTDGTPFDAAAVQANLEYLAAGSGQNGYMARSIESYEILSPTQIALHLNAPDPALVFNLSTVGGAMSSPAALGQPGSDVLPIGTGPYVYDVEDSIPNSQYVYRRNADYWNPEAYPFEVITVAPMTDTVARMNALFAGQVDGTVADVRAIAQAEASGLSVYEADVNWAGVIIADRDGTVAAPLADVRVRQALNMAFDDASILQYVDLGHGLLSDQIFPPSSPAYVPELDDYYPYDPERARELLAEAGYADGFEIIFPDIRPFASFYPIVQQQLAEIGITATFEALPPGSAIPVIRSGRYAAYVFTFSSNDPWTDIQQHLTPDAGWNAFHYSDDTLNGLIHDAQMATGDAQVAAFQAVNRYIVENAFFVPWYRQYGIYLSGSDVHVEMQPGNQAPYIRNYSPAE